MHYLNVDAGDLSNWYNLHCAAGISGQVVVDITGPVTFSSIPTGALTPTIAGNTFTYNISDFGSINNATAFGLFIQADTTITISDSICVNVSVTPTTGDNNTSNNTFNYCYHVSNSWDPNFKETYPEQVQPGFNDYFYYTVHFQNTGSAAAININLQDTLDANLDLNTFQITNYSHYCTSMLTGNKLSFNFPNIQLPDSTSNFDGSQGYVQYRIKPLANLQGGTMIHNKASIYFDYNPAVVTNTTTNEYMLSIGQSEIRNSKSEITISPNPFTNQTIITIQSPINNRQSTLIITDVLGKQIKTIRFSGKQYILEKGEMDAGIYFISVNSEQGTVNRKIIIQ